MPKDIVIERDSSYTFDIPSDAFIIDPGQCLMLEDQNIRKRNKDIFGLVILNQSMDDDGTFGKIWDNTSIHVCADGGANHLYNHFKDNPSQRINHLPDIITGDLDSLQPEVKKYYEGKGVKVIRNPSQYSTDFRKATDKVIELFIERYKNHDKIETNEEEEEDKELIIYAIGGIGGRVDQSFHSFHQLYVLSQSTICSQLVLVSKSSITFLLSEGVKHYIHTPQRILGPSVGLIPLDGPTIISTNGLMWDVQDWETSFGTKVSTSNYLACDFVSIESNKKIVFTIERKK